MGDGNDEPDSADQQPGEEFEDDRMGADEQLKRIHERLDAGENPLGETSEAEASTEVADRLLLRRVAKA
eukprot:616941-Amphidinium_carterae.1